MYCGQQQFERRMPSALNFCHYAQLWLTAFAVDSTDNGLFLLSLQHTCDNAKYEAEADDDDNDDHDDSDDCGRVAGPGPHTQSRQLTQLDWPGQEMTRAFHIVLHRKSICFEQTKHIHRFQQRR